MSEIVIVLTLQLPTTSFWLFIGNLRKSKEKLFRSCRGELIENGDYYLRELQSP